MPTRGVHIGLEPVNITSDLALETGKRYTAQNTANSGGAVLYLAEIEETSPNPERGDYALELHLNKTCLIVPVSGVNVWAWCGVESGRLVVNEAS